MQSPWRSASRRLTEWLRIAASPLTVAFVWVVDHSRWLIIPLGLGVAVCGFVGLWQTNAKHFSDDAWHRFLAVLYQVDQMFVLEYGIEATEENNWLVAARTCAALLVLVGAAKIIATMNREAFDAIKLSVLDNHIVICGLGRLGLQIARDLAKRKQELVIIERADDNPHLAELRRKGAVVLIADAGDEESLRRAAVAEAREVFAVSGSDGTNVEIAASVCALKMASRNDAPVACHLHISDSQLAAPLENYPAFRSAAPRVSASVFNLFDRTSAILLRDHLSRHRPQVGETAHYFVFGFQAMGQSLATHAARLAHYENEGRLRMSIFDRRLSTLREEFCSRFPRLAPTKIDLSQPVSKEWSSKRLRPAPAYQVGPPWGIEYAVNAEFLELSAGFEDDALIRPLVARINQSQVVPAIIVCFDEDPHRNMVVALQLKSALAAHVRKEVPIFVWLPDNKGLGRMAPGAKSDLTDDASPLRLIRFGERERVFSYDEVTNEVAATVGEELHNVYLRMVGGGTPWQELSTTFRRANIRAAEHLVIKLRIAGLLQENSTGERTLLIRDFTEEEVELLSRIEHNRWVAERLVDGWGYGPLRDDARRLRNNIVTWEQLATMPGEQEKDRQMVRGIPNLLRTNATLREAVLRVVGAQLG